MRRQSLDRVREALARLPTASRADLRTEWRRLYRSEPPPRLGRELLMAAIAYRLHEAALGGLRPESHRRLRNIAKEAGRGEEPALRVAPRLKPGTRLVREWQGHTHDWNRRRHDLALSRSGATAPGDDRRTNPCPRASAGRADCGLAATGPGTGPDVSPR